MQKQRLSELFIKAVEAQENGTPLKNIFEEIAAKYGKQPNSIRNLYYTKIKESKGNQKLEALGISQIKKNDFIAFSDQEVFDLVKHILSEQGKGKSVRAITLELGKDKAGMLRFQNKYRSTLATNSELVEKVMEQLREEGINFYNPYGRLVYNKALSENYTMQKLSYLPMLTSLAQNLEATGEINLKALLTSLSQIAESIKSRESLENQIELLKAEVERIKSMSKVEGLKQIIAKQEKGSAVGQ